MMAIRGGNVKAVLFENENRRAGRLRVLGGAAFGFSLLLHLSLMSFLLFGLPACEPERDEPGPEVMMISFMDNQPAPAPEAAPVPEAAPDPDAADEPPPAPLPQGDSLRAVPQAAEEAGPETLDELSPPADTPPEAQDRPEESPPEVRPKEQDAELRRAAPPEVSPPETKKPAKTARAKPAPRAKATPQKRQLTPYEMMTKTLGRDAGRVFGGAQGQTDPLVSMYYNRIFSLIESKWSPQTKNSSRRLEVYFNLTIEPDGRVSGIRQVKSSGDANFDRSAEQALRRSTRLPPPPSVFGGRRFTVPLVFVHGDG